MNVLTRRAALRRAAVAALTIGVAPSVLLRRERAWAASSRGKSLVIPNSGGSFLEVVQKTMVEPFMRETGASVQQVSGNMAAHTVQLRSNRANPPFDVFLGFGDDFIGLMRDGYVVPLDQRLVPSLKEVYPKFKDQWKGYGAYIDYSSVGLSYSPEAIKSPPRSWREFVERAGAGEFGHNVWFNNLPSQVRGAEVMMVIAQSLTGSYRNMDAAFAAVKKLKPYTVKFITSLNDPVTLVLNKEATIGPGWDGRTYIAHDESNGKIDWVRPKEGAAASGPVLGVVKNGNEEWANRFINFALSAGPQKAFAEQMFYGSVNMKVTYSSKLAGRIPKPADVVLADEAFIADNKAAWIERWNSEIAT